MEVQILVILIALTIVLLCAITYRWGYADGSRNLRRVNMQPGEIVEIRSVNSRTTLQVDSPKQRR